MFGWGGIFDEVNVFTKNQSQSVWFFVALTSVDDLCTCCFPLPLFADDAGLVCSLILGFGSGSICVSLNLCDDDAVVCGADVAVVTLLFLYILRSSLCSPVAATNLFGDFLRLSLTRGNILSGMTCPQLQSPRWL